MRRCICAVPGVFEYTCPSVSWIRCDSFTMLFFALIFCGFTYSVVANTLQCSVEGLRQPVESVTRYNECKNGTWIIENCPSDLVYYKILSKCVSSDRIQPILNSNINESSLHENNTTIASAQSNENKTDFVTIDDRSGPVETVQTDLAGNDDNSSELENHFLFTEFSKAMPRVTIRKPTKSKANWTTSLLNGVPEYTDISFYQSNDRSFEFRVPGGLPAEQNKVISWIRENAHKYPQTDIAYYDDNPQPSYDPPMELPVRCGTKFLEKLSGGKATPIEDNPWQVAVLRVTGESYVCGGSVITRRHVLSAAHCFQRRDRTFIPVDIILRVGDYDKEVREESQADYSVLHVIIHENYSEGRHSNDIALLTTSEDISFTTHIYPICLPNPQSEYTPGMACTVSGWGQVEDNDVPTRYLRAGQVAIVSNEECRRKTIFAHAVIGLPDIFCAEDPTKKGVDTCLGDSGGPFSCVMNGTSYLYGITAFGSYPCGQDIPSFYTNVSHYRSWILRSIRTFVVIT